MKQENNNVAFITPNAGIYARTDIASVAKEYPALWLVVLLSRRGPAYNSFYKEWAIANIQS